MGKWQLTPSLRVAKFSHVNKRGDEVLVESDGKTKLCRHGETGSTIRTWLLAEARARAEGRPLPTRKSVCDCTQTLGLQSTIDTRPLVSPPSVYDLLSSTDAEAIPVESGGKAFRLGVFAAYLDAKGNVHCKHGKRLRTRTHALRPCVWTAQAGQCKCRVALPRRMPHLCMVVRSK
jgi:hypothetical protein